MSIVENQLSRRSLMMELNNIVSQLKEVFNQLDKKDSTERQKYELERAKDKYFEELNQLLPTLTEENKGLYGEYFVKQVKITYLKNK